MKYGRKFRSGRTKKRIPGVKRSRSSRVKAYSKLGRNKRQSAFRKRRSLHVAATTSSAYGPSFNKVVFGKKMSRLPRVRQIERLGTQNRYQAMASNLLTTSLGRQNYAEFSFQTADELRAFAAGMGISGSTTVDSVNNTNDWVLKKSYNKWEMANQCSAMVNVDLYFYQCIRDAGSTPGELWEEGNQEQQNSSGVTVGVPGVTPQGNEKVGMFYKLKRVVHHVIKPGETHVQTIEVEHHKMVHNELLYSESGQDRGNLYLAGYTWFVLAILRGAPSATTLDIATTANCCVALSQFRTTDATYLADTSNNLRVDNSIAFGTGLGTVEVYNQGSGQIETVDTIN